jgi:heat shock protein HtpX
MNYLKTTLFLGLLTGLMMAIGYGLGGQSGMFLALFFSGIMNFGAYWWSHKLVLSVYGAKKSEKMNIRSFIVCSKI